MPSWSQTLSVEWGRPTNNQNRIHTYHSLISKENEYPLGRASFLEAYTVKKYSRGPFQEDRNREYTNLLRSWYIPQIIALINSVLEAKLDGDRTNDTRDCL